MLVVTNTADDPREPGDDGPDEAAPAEQPTGEEQAEENRQREKIETPSRRVARNIAEAQRLVVARRDA
jgi:hypothetical protein